MDKFLFKRGNKAKLPQLQTGEPFLSKDEERLYIGGNNGNIPLPNKQDMDEVTTRLEETKQDLAVRGYDVRWNALLVTDEDWSPAIMAANDYLKENGGGTILIPSKGEFFFKTDIQIDSGIDFRGTMAVLKAGARNVSINFSGNNNVDGIIFDGNNLTGNFINFKGSNVQFKNNIVRNVYGDETTQNTTGIRITKEASNCIVQNNNFENFSAFENGIESDLIGAIRPIWVQGKNALIDGNSFRGIVGNEDADYIYVSADIIQSSEYPFNKSPLVTGYFKEIFTVITNNTFYNATKSPIKLQASGCLVDSNKVINNGVDIRYCFRGYSSIGNTIINNTVYLTNARIISSVFQFQYTKNTIIKGNVIHTDTNLDTSILTTGNDLIYNQDLDYDSNILDLDKYNITNMFYLSGATNVALSKNKIKANEVQQTFTYNADVVDKVLKKDNEFYFDKISYPIIINSDSLGVSNIDFNNNIFRINELLPTGSHFFAFRKVSNLKFYKNTFELIKSGQTIQVLLDNCSNVKINKNDFDARIVINDGCNDINILENYFGDAVLSAVYINSTGNNPSSNIYVDKNMVKKCTYLVSLNGDTSKKNVEVVNNIVLAFVTEQQNIVYLDTIALTVQDMNEIYVRGNTPARRFDHGYTSERPIFRKDIGYKYFDYTLGYEITWNGSNWVNGSGQTV